MIVATARRLPHMRCMTQTDFDPAPEPPRDLALAEAPGAGLTGQDLADLRRAVALLEHDRLIARIASVAGVAVERLGRMLPEAAHETIQAVAERALRLALDGVSLTVVTADGRNSRLGWLGRRMSTPAFDKAAVALSGLTGGAGGFAGTIIELPVTTAMMLRSIAQIAASEGEDIASETGRLECLSVFALGSPSPTDDETAESGYYAVRVALAEAMGRTAGRTLDQLVPRILQPVVARFGVPVGWKFAGQAVPVAGAAAGAMINLAFIDHFQDKARGHFIVRRLERAHGQDAVRACYAELRAEYHARQSRRR
jgi:hypothetical protein